jgi:DivIVA domain-containing protein
MSVFQPDTGSGQPTASDLPAFQMVRRGYDPQQVDAYLPQLMARLEEAVDRYAKAERARGELQREVASLQEHTPSFEQLGAEAATVLAEAGRSAELLVEKARRRAETVVEQAQQQAEQARADVTNEAKTALAAASDAAERIRQQVEQERAALDSETAQVREFRDGLLDDLGRVHGDIGALLERTRSHKAQEPPASGGAARPEADPAPDLAVQQASEPAGAGESAQSQPVQAPTGARGQGAAPAQAAPARRPGPLSAPAGQQSRRPRPAG